MDSKPGGRSSDLKGGLGWMAAGVVIVALAWRMDRFASMGGTVYTAPGLVPGLFGLALLVLGAALAWRGRRPQGHDRTAAEPLLNRRVLVTLTLTLAYAAGAVGRLPFAPATAVFVATFAWLYADTARGPRRVIGALLAGVLTAAVVVLVFEDLFLVRLP